MRGAVKGYRGMGMDGFVARWYAKNTAKSMDSFRADARRVAALLPPNAQVLEVAPGPGYFAIELAKLGDYHITGLDISKTFVEIARHNSESAGVRVEFRQGSASEMPLDADRFDFVFCRAAFKNFSQPLQALQEIYRVLKPGGRALIVDLRRGAPMKAINQEISRMRLGWFNALLTRLTFRFVLLRRAYTQQEFEALVAQTKLRLVRIEGDLGMDIWLEKVSS
jgi:ubiquinone/menaquinone biosynthesis C-methylase UbiE